MFQDKECGFGGQGYLIFQHRYNSPFYRAYKMFGMFERFDMIL